MDPIAWCEGFNKRDALDTPARQPPLRAIAIPSKPPSFSDIERFDAVPCTRYVNCSSR